MPPKFPPAGIGIRPFNPSGAGLSGPLPPVAPPNTFPDGGLPMKWTLRAASLSTFLTALAAACLYANPTWAEDAGVDFWHVVDDQERIVAAEESARRFDKEIDRAMQRMAVRAETLRDVIDGRLTFDEGARRFVELNRTLPAHLAEYMCQRYPAQTELERAARQLVSYLRLTREPAALALAKEWERVLAGRG
jgi:hypothetical protein